MLTNLAGYPLGAAIFPGEKYPLLVVKSLFSGSSVVESPCLAVQST